MFGLYDTADNLWMGTEQGPLLYGDEMIARVAAMMCDRTLHQPLGRTRACVFKPAHLTLRDHKPLLESAVDALAQLELGYF
jgi:hypothetical protein